MNLFPCSHAYTSRIELRALFLQLLPFSFGALSFLERTTRTIIKVQLS